MVSTYKRLKLHRDDRGEALAMVLVIITFISILAGVLMFVAYAGYLMRTVDRQGKDNFYTAETVLDEINVGLQEEISAALSKAYEEVMINYASYPNATERNKALRTLYFDELKKNLRKNSAGDTVSEGYYSIAKLREYLSDEIKGDSDATRGGFITYGAIVESNISFNDDEIDYVMDVNNTRLLLKDLKVSYVNETGYVSIISTDIRIDLPSFNFSQSAELPALDSCSMIADDTLYMGNTTAGGSIVIKGDAYAGQMYVGTPDDEVHSSLDSENVLSFPMLLATSVSFENMQGENAASMSLVVSRQNIEVNEGSEFEISNAELWGQNMSVDSATVSLDGNINFKDDLTLSGMSSNVSLSGEYNGFGYLAAGSNTGNSSTGGTTDDGDEEDDAVSNAYSSPDASSSIVINGRNSTLDLSGLQRLTISGRAYVATAYNGSDASATDQEKSNKANVMMGESVAVKSNQLIYLVPPEALGCKIEKDGTVGDSEFGANPMTLEQYEELTVLHPESYVLLDGDRSLPVLGGKSLSNYINQETIAGGDGTKAYVPEVVFKQTNAGPLVYCYLRFSDEDAANRYFMDYYNLNAEYVDRYMQLYARDIKMADNLLYLNIAGSMLAYEGEDTWSVISPAESSGTTTQAQRISALKDDMFSSLSAKLVSTSNQLTSTELSRTAFPNIIDELEVENVLDAKRSRTVTISTGDEPGADSMILTANDYEVNSGTDAKIIVCLGNVTVKSSYKGLIIAKGSITIEADSDITLEPIDSTSFSNILRTRIDELTTDENNVYYLMNVFTDGISYATSGNAAFDVGTSRVSLVDLISYERWLKK